MKSLGFVELPNFADAMDTLDIMLKASGVSFVTWEKALGGRLVTIIVEGDVGSVQEAVDTARARSKGKIAASAVIANPHDETRRMAELSAKRLFGGKA